MIPQSALLKWLTTLLVLLVGLTASPAGAFPLRSRLSSLRLYYVHEQNNHFAAVHPQGCKRRSTQIYIPSIRTGALFLSLWNHPYSYKSTLGWRRRRRSRQNDNKATKMSIKGYHRHLRYETLTTWTNRGMSSNDNNYSFNGGPSRTTQRRDMNSLQDWAIQQGIQIASGVKLVENDNQDWGVTLDQRQESGTAILSVPSSVILSSSSVVSLLIEAALRTSPSSRPIHISGEERETIHSTIIDFLSHSLESHGGGSGGKGMGYYLPECLLMLQLLWESFLDVKSQWYPWLQSLPNEFSNGIYLDPIARRHIQRMEPTYLQQHELQFHSCSTAIQSWLSTHEATKVLGLESFALFLKCTSLSPTKDNDDDDNNNNNNTRSIFHWAFSVVFSRSWRTSTNEHAMIVPLGDMFNHDSQKANIVPRHGGGDDGNNYLQLCLKDTADAGSDLYLSYGLTQYPARFLIVFGFFSNDLCPNGVYANIEPIQQKNDELLVQWFFQDATQLVFLTTTNQQGGSNSVITDPVWNAVLFRVLQQHQQQQSHENCNHSDAMTAVVDLQRLREALYHSRSQDKEDPPQPSSSVSMEDLLFYLHQKWELEVAIWLHEHVQDLLSKRYSPLTTTHNSNSTTITIMAYNDFMRDILQRVLDETTIAVEEAKQRLRSHN